MRKCENFSDDNYSFVGAFGVVRGIAEWIGILEGEVEATQETLDGSVEAGGVGADVIGAETGREGGGHADLDESGLHRGLEDVGRRARGSTGNKRLFSQVGRPILFNLDN